MKHRLAVPAAAMVERGGIERPHTEGEGGG